MSIVYEWQFPALDVKYSVGEMKNVVTTIHWVLNATSEDGYFASVYGTISVPEPTPEVFVSYEDLTKKEVQTWVESAMRESSIQSELVSEENDDYVEETPSDPIQNLRDNLAKQIEAARTPVTGTLNPPWTV